MSFPKTLSEAPALIPEKPSDSALPDNSKHVVEDYGERHYDEMDNNGGVHYNKVEEKDAGGDLFTVKTEDCLELDSLCTGVKEMDVFHPLKLDLYRNKRKVAMVSLHTRNKAIKKADKLWRKFKSAEKEADFRDLEFKSVGAELMDLERQLGLPRNDSFFLIPSVQNKTMLTLRRVTGESLVCGETSMWEYILGGLGGLGALAGVGAFIFKIVKCCSRDKKKKTVPGVGEHSLDGSWPAKVSTAKQTQTVGVGEGELAGAVVSLRRDLCGLVSGAVEDGFLAAMGSVRGAEGGEKVEIGVTAGGQQLATDGGGGDSLDLSQDTVYNQVNSTPMQHTRSFSQAFDPEMGRGGYYDSTADNTVTLKRR